MIDAASFTKQLGGEWRGHAGMAPCPVCQPERRRDQRGLSLRSEEGKLLAFCHKSGCDFRLICERGHLPLKAAEHDGEAERVAAARLVEYQAKQLEKARGLWAMGKPINGTHGEEYLRRRGITCPLPEALRYLPDTCHAPSARYVSAIVADVSSGGVHRTFLDKRGCRLPKSAKMMLGPCSGGAVALSRGAGPLVVCEGIETGLSLVQMLSNQRPTVWAGLSTSGVKGLMLPQRASELIVAPDGDDAGREAAQRLGERASLLGWQVNIMAPPDGRDWNDVLVGGVAA